MGNLVLIQHNPNEGLKLQLLQVPDIVSQVLIQHNPNEGLKLAHAPPRPPCGKCSFSTTRTRD